MAREVEQEPRKEGAAQSIEMLKAVIDGDTYDAVGTRFGVTRTAVERRIKSIAARLCKACRIQPLESGDARQAQSGRTAQVPWERIERAFAPLFEAGDTDTGFKVRLMMVALVGSRREHTYDSEAASLMLTSEHWIPVEGIHELPLVHALLEQRRRFVKPLRYDAKSAAAFAKVLLLDTGAAAVPLHVVSPFMTPQERVAKERAIAAIGSGAWMWVTDDRMPALPKAYAC